MFWVTPPADQGSRAPLLGKGEIEQVVYTNRFEHVGHQRKLNDQAGKTSSDQAQTSLLWKMQTIKQLNFFKEINF